jgi:hypothetical protein
MLYAFHPDGTPLAGWPVVLAPMRRLGFGPLGGGWYCSPSVFRRNGKDMLVLQAPGYGICVLGADRTITTFPGGDMAVNIPLADIDHAGIMDVVMGRVACTVDGAPIPTWPLSKRFRNGYAPCIGSATGDGQIQLFHLFYTNRGTPYADLAGFDTSGNRLTGWPQKIDDPSWLAPVMGDLIGDGKMEVVGAYGTHIFAWSWDGKALPNTTVDGPMIGILKSGLFASTASPALADLDGSGKADIIVYDTRSHAIRAWHGNGVGIGDEHKGPPTTQDMVRSLVASMAGAPIADGVIARLPGDLHGVSVVSLGDDPSVMDFFAGTYWVRRFPDGKTTVTNMLPTDAQIEWTQPTIADVEGTGQADAIFGLSDGRVFVYRTGLAYHAERMQWPTANGNFQHTGAWKSQIAKPPVAQAPAAQPPAALLAPGLQLRLVAAPGDTADADQMVNPIDHQPVRVLKNVELDERDLARVYPVQQDGQVMVGIDFSPAGSQKFASLTAANIHHQLAIVLNGSLLSMPTINSKISGSGVIEAEGFTTQQVQTLIDSINSRIAGAAHL